jgi:hypothetical protein
MYNELMEATNIVFETLGEMQDELLVHGECRVYQDALKIGGDVLERVRAECEGVVVDAAGRHCGYYFQSDPPPCLNTQNILDERGAE